MVADPLVEVLAVIAQCRHDPWSPPAPPRFRNWLNDWLGLGPPTESSCWHQTPSKNTNEAPPRIVEFGGWVGGVTRRVPGFRLVHDGQVGRGGALCRRGR